MSHLLNTRKNIQKSLLSAFLIIAFAGGGLVASTTTFFDFPAIAGLPYQNKVNPELTIYNQNFALVKDYRDLKFTRGVNTIFLDDVAALIDPTSVHFKSLSSPNSVSVLEQNFRYDLINKSNILDRMVGQKIRFRKNNEIKEGILLNPVTNYVRYNNGYNNNNYYNTSYNKTTTHEFAVETDEGILLTTLGDVLVDELPEGLYPRPTLMWHLANKQPGTHKSEVSYLTDGINWHCDYVAIINKDDSKIDLTAWVTLDNQSGANYDNATLKLVAGDVRKIKQPGAGGRWKEEAKSRALEMDALMEGNKGFKEESFFEYHLYTLQGKTTVTNNETKQLTMASATQVPIKKKYIYDPDRVNYYKWFYTGWNSGYYGTYEWYNNNNRPGIGRDTAQYKKVNTLLIMENSERNHLGIPLPKGRVRVNKADSSGSLQFIGEDWIDHTPKDEKVEMYLGDAFDIVGEKKRINYKRESDVIEETYEIKLRNHKKETVTVHAMDHLFGDWTIYEKSHGYKKTDAHTVDFEVKVPPNGERVVTYSVRIKRI